MENHEITEELLDSNQRMDLASVRPGDRQVSVDELFDWLLVNADPVLNLLMLMLMICPDIG